MRRTVSQQINLNYYKRVSLFFIFWRKVQFESVTNNLVYCILIRLTL